MRVPYLLDPPPSLDPDEEAIVSRIRTRRGPRGLFKLDLALLHSPPVADGWSVFLSAVRTQTSLPADLREIAISRAALHLGAWVEFDAHRRILAATPDFQTDGATKMKVVERVDTKEGRGPLSEIQWVVLRYADAVTRDVQVEDELFDGLKKGGLDDQAVVEVTVTVAAYNCVGRFFVALDVGERNGSGPGEL
jgi:alkylhydroperoxidase family enzyme